MFFVAGSCKRFWVIFHERLGNSFILYGRLPLLAFHKLSPHTAKSNVLIISLQWISAWNFYIWLKWNCFNYWKERYMLMLSRRCIILVLQSWLFMLLITIDTDHVICSVHVLLHISFIFVSPVFLPFMEFECSFYCCQAKQRNKNTPLPLLW